LPGDTVQNNRADTDQAAMSNGAGMQGYLVPNGDVITHVQAATTGAEGPIVRHMQYRIVLNIGALADNDLVYVTAYGSAWPE
jgi:hypothetical protein